MKISSFISNVEGHNDFSVVLNNEEGFGICNEKTGVEYTVLKEAVEKHEWSVLESILLGDREPRTLRHMTRIVGYFSQIENWNRSKIGELRSRHAGNYAVEATAKVCEAISA